MRPDKIISEVKAAKERDTAKGTGPRKSPKSFHEVDDVDEVAPEKDTLSMAHSPHDDLPAVLEEVAEDLMDDAQRPATMGNLAWAFRRVARKLGDTP
jgi:hypothetical protein